MKSHRALAISVEAAMLGQGGGEAKGLAAGSARVGPRSCVHPQMHLQLRAIYC